MFTYMATSFDPKLGHYQGITREIETYTETKSINWRYPFTSKDTLKMCAKYTYICKDSLKEA